MNGPPQVKKASTRDSGLLTTGWARSSGSPDLVNARPLVNKPGNDLSESHATLSQYDHHTDAVARAKSDEPVKGLTPSRFILAIKERPHPSD